MIKQKYPYEVAAPSQGQITIFRNKENGYRYYKKSDNSIVRMNDEVNGETFNIYEKNITVVNNLTEDSMDILDTDKSGIDLATVKFCCQSGGVVPVSAMGGFGGGGRGRTGPQGPSGGAQGAQGAAGTTGAQGASGGATSGFAEYVQYTQAPNNSVASGLALELLTDNPTGVFNTIGIITAGAPTQGTAFNLPIGFYMVDYETSTSSVGPLVISQGTVAGGPFTADINTKAGSTTATTWIHGRGIVESSVANGQWIIVGPTDSVTAAVVPAGGAPQYIVRVTFLKIG